MDVTRRLEELELEVHRLRDRLCDLESRLKRGFQVDGSVDANEFRLIDRRGRIRAQLLVSEDHLQEEFVKHKARNMTPSGMEPPEFGPDLAIYDENGHKYICVGISPETVLTDTGEHFHPTRKIAYLHLGSNIQITSRTTAADLVMVDEERSSVGAVRPAVRLSTKEGLSIFYNGRYHAFPEGSAPILRIIRWIRHLIGCD